MLTSHARHGIARTMPLLVLTGFVAAVFAALSCARPVVDPPRAALETLTNVNIDDCSEGCLGCFVPRTHIPDANGRLWELDEIPGHTVRGLDVRNAAWAGADLHDATFIDCDFRRCDLTGANLDDVSFERCRLDGARMDNVEFRRMDFSGCYVEGAKIDGHELAPWSSNGASHLAWFEILRTTDAIKPPN